MVRLPNASTTKMVTAMVVVNQTDLDAEVTLSAEAGSVGGGLVDLEAGSTFSVKELLHALMLASSNEAAVALAEHVAGSEAAFVETMNEVAGDLGAESTHFVTPHGLDTPGHYSTAQDLAILGLALLDDPVLAEIVRTRSTTIQSEQGHALDLENSNGLLETYSGSVGIKTGMTVGAGDVLVAAARRRGALVVAVAMRSADAEVDAGQLLDLGFEVGTASLRRESKKVVTDVRAGISALLANISEAVGASR